MGARFFKRSPTYNLYKVLLPFSQPLVAYVVVGIHSYVLLLACPPT